MKVEAITTCVGANCLEMLRFTAPQNKKCFDNYIVVTSPEDTSTQNYCKYIGLSCVVTSEFKKYNFGFNKGAAINEGLEHLKYNDWVYHIDADIILKNGYRDTLDKELDDPEYFYGSRRVIIENYKNLIDLVAGNKKEEDFLSYPGVGYGYSQCWNQQSKVIKSGAIYPEIYEKGESDWRWRNLWGDLANKDYDLTGLLKRISVNVWHLGLPDISGADSFWK